MLFEVFDKRRAPRSLLLEPFFFVLGTMLVIKNPIGIIIEAINIAFKSIGKTPDCYTSDSISAFLIVVSPCNVVTCAGGKYFNFMTTGESFGNQSAVVFRAT